MQELMILEQYKNNEEELITSIIQSRGANLPSNLESVRNIFEFTDIKAKAWKMLADKMKNINDQADLYQSAQRSAQKWSISALYAQKRMGELTKDIPAETTPRFIRQKYKNDNNGGVNSKTATWMNKDGAKGTIPTATWRDAERMAKHPEIFEKVIEKAKASETIEVPTKTTILNTIRVETQKEVNERAKRKGDAKVINETTTTTKDYYDLIKGFKEGIKLAILNAEVGKFAPEGKNFMIKKHDEIRNLLKQLEELI